MSSGPISKAGSATTNSRSTPVRPTKSGTGALCAYAINFSKVVPPGATCRFRRRNQEDEYFRGRLKRATGICNDEPENGVAFLGPVAQTEVHGSPIPQTRRKVVQPRFIETTANGTIFRCFAVRGGKTTARSKPVKPLC